MANETSVESAAVQRMRARGLIGDAEVRARGLPFCSCGCREAHSFATRETFDGKRIDLWTDGRITHRVPGFPYLAGLGAPRSDWSIRVRIAAVRLIADDVGLYTLAEVVTAVRVAEKTYAHNWSDDAARRAFVRSKTIQHFNLGLSNLARAALDGANGHGVLGEAMRKAGGR